MEIEFCRSSSSDVIDAFRVGGQGMVAVPKIDLFSSWDAISWLMACKRQDAE